MPPNSSMCTSFGLFRNRDLLTAHEDVFNSYIYCRLYVYSFVVPLLETVTRNLNLVMRNAKAR